MDVAGKPQFSWTITYQVCQLLWGKTHASGPLPSWKMQYCRGNRPLHKLLQFKYEWVWSHVGSWRGKDRFQLGMAKKYFREKEFNLNIRMSGISKGSKSIIGRLSPLTLWLKHHMKLAKCTLTLSGWYKGLKGMRQCINQNGLVYATVTNNPKISVAWNNNTYFVQLRVHHG